MATRYHCKNKSNLNNTQQKRQRPHRTSLHKRIALHTSSVLLLLGGGFLPLPVSFVGQTYTMDVTARVPAALPSAPAIITSPADQQHVTTPHISVNGTCPDNSYVKVFVGGNQVGVANCSGGTFSVPVTLADGTNTLLAKVYNLTDDEGPTSSPVTVFYDGPTQPETPPQVPEQLTISTVDGTHFFRFGLVSTDLPTFTGFAPPFSHIIVTIHSNVVTCETDANSRGFWACTITTPLELGEHTVAVVAVTPDGRTLRYPVFMIDVVASRVGVAQPHQAPLTFDVPFTYKVRQPGDAWQWSVTVKGGHPPYTLAIDWGDGQTEQVAQPDANAVTLNHTYNQAGTYLPLVVATDAQGATGTYQLLADVRDKTPVALQFVQSFFSGVSPWVAWPVYVAILVGVGAFWAWELANLRRHLVQRRARHTHA